MKSFIYVLVTLFVSSTCLTLASVKSDYMQGREAFYKQEYQMALKFYDNAILKDPQFVDAYCGKGEIEIELKKYDSAIEDYTRAIELNENNIDAYIGRAAAYGLKPNPNLKLAREDLDKAIEIDSNNVDALKARAMVNYGLKDKKSAYIDINNVIEIAPENAHAYGIKAMFEFGDFKFADAMKNFGKYNEYNKVKEEVEEKPVELKFEQGFEQNL